DLAVALGLPQNQIRVVAPEVGGGFGVKFGLYPEDAVLAVIALVHRIPVRWSETRIEHMVATTHGRAQVTDMEAAVRKDGTITALRMHVTADIGAYPIFTFIPDLTVMMGVGVYRVRDVDLRTTCVFTNTTSVAAYRGAWSRAGRSPPSPARPRMARATRRPSPRSSPTTWASPMTRSSSATATPPTPPWGTGRAGAGAWPSAAPPSCAPRPRCGRRPA